MIKKRKIAIIGAGISGLSVGYYLKKNKNIDLDIFESTSIPGGVLSSERINDCVIEWGARGIRPSGKGEITLQIVKEIGIFNDLVFSSESSRKRYLYHNGKLNLVPFSIQSIIKSPYLKLIISSIFKDLLSKSVNSDESIYSFFERHIGQKSTNLFIDSLISGIWAGNIKTMSVKAAFPELKKSEKKFGSIILSQLFANRSNTKSQFSKKITSKALFSFKNGMQDLCNGLSDKLVDNISYMSEVSDIKIDKKIKINVNNKDFFYDHVVSTIPSYSLSKIVDLKLSKILQQFNYSSIAVYNIIIPKNTFNFDGFGFLVPSSEKSIVLGVIANSNTFIEHSSKFFESYTIMLGGERYSYDFLSKIDIRKISLQFLKKVFKTEVIVKEDSLRIIRNAIPQYDLNHYKKINKLEKLNIKNFHIGGNYLSGVALKDIIFNSRELANKILFNC